MEKWALIFVICMLTNAVVSLGTLALLWRWDLWRIRLQHLQLKSWLAWRLLWPWAKYQAQRVADFVILIVLLALLVISSRVA